MEKTKYCIYKGCSREATIWRGKLIKSRDFVSAGFCEEHQEKKCINLFGKYGVHGIYDKSIQLIDNTTKSGQIINLIEQ